MSEIPFIDHVTFKPAPERDWPSGLRGFVSFRIGGLKVDGVAVRQTARGRTTLSFPARRDRAGRSHPYLHPVDDEARRAIEERILGAIDIDGGGQR